MAGRLARCRSFVEKILEIDSLGLELPRGRDLDYNAWNCNYDCDCDCVQERLTHMIWPQDDVHQPRGFAGTETQGIH